MNDATDPIVFAVQSAFLELLELTQQVVPHDNTEGKEAFRLEAQKTVLMFIAAIMISNRQYNPTQQSFLSLLVDCKDKPGGEARYLNDYAVLWIEASKTVPAFFNAALEFDALTHAGAARSMLRQIQLIGNNVCAVARSASASERQTVQAYIIFLENLIEQREAETQSVHVKLPIIEEKPIEPPIVRIPQEQFNQAVTNIVARPTRSAELLWIPPNEPINVGDYRIPSGMLYISDGPSSVMEASAINLRFPIGRPVQGFESQLSYYPQYYSLSPNQRATYLEWLAGNRRDSDPGSRELGYVFLFFYGLERRLLVEKGQEQEVVAEIVRLLHQYGSVTRSSSLQSYGCQLIHFWGWQQGLAYYVQLLDWMKTLPVSLLGNDELAIILASKFQSSVPLTSDMAYELASRMEESRRSIVVSRVNKEFRKLFTKRFSDHYPEGLILARSKRVSQINYRPASPTMLYGSSMRFSIQIPDVLGLSSQFKGLPKIWNSCVEDLNGYSRVKSKVGGTSESLKSYMALPKELHVSVSHPLAELWKEILGGAHAGKDCTLLAVGTAARLLSLPQRNKLTPGQSRELAQAIESLGFAVEPDARFDATYSWDQELAIFKPDNQTDAIPSQSYLGASVLLKLCVLVAGADGNVAHEELEVSRRFVQQRITLTPGDRKRLEVLEQILVTDPNRISNSLARIARPVPKQQRELICEVLVYVAAADNVITKDEIRALEKIFKAFELPHSALEERLTAIRPEFGEVTIQSDGSRVPGEPIPQPSRAFHIDMARVDRIAEETSEVVGLLAREMADDESEPAEYSGLENAPAPTAVPATGHDAHPIPNLPLAFASLEPKYHPVLLKLSERNTWSRTDFDSLAKEFKLMPLDAFDTINGWADEHLGDFLLEGDDEIVVHRELLK